MAKKAVQRNSPAPAIKHDTVKMVMELRDQVRAQILKVFEIKSTFVECVVALEETDIPNRYKLRADFVINGHPMSVEESWYDQGNGVPQWTRDRIKTKIAESIVGVMLSGAWDKIVMVTLPEKKKAHA